MALPKDGCLDGAKITEVGGVGYKELLVMALPKDDSIDGAKVAEAISVKLPDVGGAIRVFDAMIRHRVSDSYVLSQGQVFLLLKC